MEHFRNHSRTIPENLSKFDPDTRRTRYGHSEYFEDNPRTATRFLLNSPMQKTTTLIEFKLLLKSKCEKSIQIYN